MIANGKTLNLRTLPAAGKEILPSSFNIPLNKPSPEPNDKLFSGDGVSILPIPSSIESLEFKPSNIPDPFVKPASWFNISAS